MDLKTDVHGHLYCAHVAAHCCCNGIIALPNSFGGSIFQMNYSHIAWPKTPTCHFQQHEKIVAASYKYSGNKNNRIVWTSMIIVMWRKSCWGVKMGENLGGSRVVKYHRKLWQNKAERSQWSLL